jgi:hypothetical protein
MNLIPKVLLFIPLSYLVSADFINHYLHSIYTQKTYKAIYQSLKNKRLRATLCTKHQHPMSAYAQTHTHQMGMKLAQTYRREFSTITA